MLSLARDDVSLPSKDDELLDYDELIRGIDEQLLAIDALPLPSPPPAAAVPFSVPPSPLSANAATSPARERQEPSIGFKEPSVGPNPQVWTHIQVGSTPFSIFLPISVRPRPLGSPMEGRPRAQQQPRIRCSDSGGSGGPGVGRRGNTGVVGLGSAVGRGVD